MSDGDFPFQTFTLRAEGYDRGEVDAYVAQLQGEIGRLRRAAEGSSGPLDARLHDPEGAVTRTLAIAQETADRVLHDAQVEADRRRSEADEQATTTIADADARAAKMMADIETQTAEVRAQGIAAARAAIQVERDKAVAELGHIRRVRDDIRAEAVELKTVLERYSRQAIEASEVLSAAASGPLMSFDLPDYVAADVALAGVVDDVDVVAPAPTLAAVDDLPGASDAVWADDHEDDDASEADGDGHVVESSSSAEAAETAGTLDVGDSWLLDIDDGDDDSDDDRSATDEPEPMWADANEQTDDDHGGEEPGDSDAIEPEVDVAWNDDDGDEDDDWFSSDIDDDTELAQVISLDGDPVAEVLPSDLDAPTNAASGAFLAEVRAAADDDVALPPETEGSVASDRFLSELRGVTESPSIDDAEIDDEAADRFFDAD